MINLFCDTILPGDDELGLLPASYVDMSRYIAAHEIEDQVKEYLALLESVSQEKFESAFEDLNSTNRLKCVEVSKRKNIRLATAVIVHCLKAYYTNADVLNKLPGGAIPPFPAGNTLGEDDWSLLEPVYERGAIFRSEPL
jgi:hypothetical protein